MMFYFVGLLVFSVTFCKILRILIEWYFVRSFVKNVCKDRDDSHGYQHMKEVMILALKLYLNDSLFGCKINFNLENIRMIGIVALLHDVDDGKYDVDGTLSKKLEEFVKKFFPFDDNIINIIHRISHSKEIKMRKEGTLDWINVLKYDGLLIRDYVSDADKIFSLGKEGHYRSKQYNGKKLGEKYNGNYDEIQLFELVDWIMNDKLITLDQYCYTESGHNMAVKKREEICEIHKMWKINLGFD